MKLAIEWVNEVGETVANALMSGKQPPGTEVEQLIQRIQEDATKHYTAWLVEGRYDSPQQYLTMGGDGMFTWTAHKDKAIHFCRRSDAERVSAECEDAWRITEHSFSK